MTTNIVSTNETNNKNATQNRNRKKRALVFVIAAISLAVIAGFLQSIALKAIFAAFCGVAIGISAIIAKSVHTESSAAEKSRFPAYKIGLAAALFLATMACLVGAIVSPGVLKVVCATVLGLGLTFCSKLIVSMVSHVVDNNLARIIPQETTIKSSIAPVPQNAANLSDNNKKENVTTFQGTAPNSPNANNTSVNTYDQTGDISDYEMNNNRSAGMYADNTKPTNNVANDSTTDNKGVKSMDDETQMIEMTNMANEPK